MKNIIIATAGHIDHGKTRLIKEITGKDTSRHKEEKLRKMTIDLGYANLKIKDCNMSFIDVPGHRDYLKNTICGILNANIVVLVISAKDGWCNQTYEHFDIVNHISVNNLIIAITKVDVADEDSVKDLIVKSEKNLKKTDIKNTDICIIDYSDNESVKKIINKLYQMSKNISPMYSLHSIFKIDNSFSMKGYGTIVSGNLLYGLFTKDDELTIYPQKLKTRIKSIQNNNIEYKKFFSYSRLALNISSVKKDEVKRGDVLSKSDDLQSSKIVDVLIKTSDNLSRNIKNYEVVKIYTGTTNTFAQIINLKGKFLSPNTLTIIQLRLEEEIMIFLKDDLIILDTSSKEIIAGGQAVCVSDYKKSKLDIDLSYDIDTIVLYLLIKKEKINHMRYFEKILNLNLNSKDTLFQEKIDILIKDKNILKIDDSLLIDYEFFVKLKKNIQNIIKEYKNLNIYKETMSMDIIYKNLYYIDRTFVKKIVESLGYEIENLKIFVKDEKYQKNTKFEEIYNFLKYHIENMEKPVLIKDIIQDEKIKKDILQNNMKKYFRQISNDYICSKKLLDKYLEFVNEHFKNNEKLSINDFKSNFSLSRNMTVVILEYFDLQKITKRFENYRIKAYNNKLS